MLLVLISVVNLKLYIPWCAVGWRLCAVRLINTNDTSNYQSTNETHYTQENTTITTHKGSRQLILIETRYQLQPSDKELHTEHTPLRTVILH